MDFQTPEWVGRYMVGLLPDGIKTVLEPTPGEGNLVRLLSGYEVTAPEDFWKVEGKFDAVVMNPPFSPMLVGYRILYRCMEMSDTVIALMPWLVLINSAKRTRDIMGWGLKSITHLPRKAFDGSRVQTCILQMERGHSGMCEFRAIEEAGMFMDVRNAVNIVENADKKGDEKCRT